MWHSTETPEVKTDTKTCYADIGQGPGDGLKSGNKQLRGLLCVAPGRITSKMEEVKVEMTEPSSEPCKHAERYFATQSIQGKTAYIKFYSDSSDKCEVRITVEYEPPKPPAATAAASASMAAAKTPGSTLPVVIRRKGG